MITEEQVNRANSIRKLLAKWRPEIIDELCACGHLRSQHANTLALGHGKCERDNCSCYKFTWAEFVKAKRI